MTESSVEAERFVTQVNRFAALDRRRTIIGTATVIAIWFIVVGSSFIVVAKARSALARTAAENHNLTRRNDELRANYSNLLRARETLQGSIESLQQTNQKLRRENTELSDLVGKLHGPLAAIVKPELSLQRLDGVFNYGMQTYNVIMFIRVPQTRLAGIASVQYEIDHPAKLEKVMTGRLPANGFAVGYQGYACFSNVKINVTTVSGTTFTIPYSMCDDWHKLTREMKP
jgi:cell division protein FtsB